VPRGRQEGPEQSRIRSTEFGSFRGDGKRGSGVTPNEKKGFGSEKGMQVNRSSKRKSI